MFQRFLFSCCTLYILYHSILRYAKWCIHFCVPGTTLHRTLANDGKTYELFLEKDPASLLGRTYDLDTHFIGRIIAVKGKHFLIPNVSQRHKKNSTGPPVLRNSSSPAPRTPAPAAGSVVAVAVAVAAVSGASAVEAIVVAVAVTTSRAVGFTVATTTAVGVAVAAVVVALTLGRAVEEVLEEGAAAEVTLAAPAAVEAEITAAAVGISKVVAEDRGSVALLRPRERNSRKIGLVVGEVEVVAAVVVEEGAAAGVASSCRCTPGQWRRLRSQPMGGRQRRTTRKRPE